jgi:hypothetical protein
MEEMFENYPSLETKSNKVPENEEEKWKWKWNIKSYMLK